MIIFDEDKEKKWVLELRDKEEEDLAQIMSGRYNIPYLDLSVTPINVDAIRLVSEIEAREGQLGVFNEVDKKVSIGVLSPKNPKTNEVIDKLKKQGYIPELFMVSHT